MGNINKVQNHEYNVSEENREEMDVENPKRSNGDWNWLYPNKQAKQRNRRNSHQPSQHWIGSDHRMVMSNITLDVEVEMKNWLPRGHQK